MIDWSEGLPLMIGPYEVGLTETSPETSAYWEGVGRGELMIKRCKDCGDHLHPRRIFCPNCGSNELADLKSGGTGVVYTFSTIYRPPSEEFEAPYTNGIVELDEGVFLYGRLVGSEPEAISVGDRVEVDFEPVQAGGERLPVYRVR
jgi:hypothetical protein